ncbi:MAG TPA: hypothetical protein VNP92_18095 [Actinophytocola sp.]|nr:hypothetical protein [Actinophytocola sp.]
MSQPVKTGVTSQELKTAATNANVSGADLDAAATKIVELIGLPSFKQAMTEQPELRGLDPVRVVDLIAATLAESLFAGAGAEEDVLIEVSGQYVQVPAGQRELLQSAVARVLTTKTAEVEKLLKAKS